ncbi:hypothetical protein evm_006262 [Chilo suppressalis]|nr:hypothetical protein evm_006262 [Chilo suppressalis]
MYSICILSVTLASHNTSLYSAYFGARLIGYDKDNDGKISNVELENIIESREHDLTDNVVDKIMNLADRDNSGYLDSKEFVDMMHHPVFGDFVARYVNSIIPHRDPVDTTERKYDKECSCWPPPVCMILISLVEIVVFCYDATQGNTDANGPIAIIFIYNPHKRQEAWRFITYMLVHVGVMHLLFNLLVQIFLGVPLEMMHRWWRVTLVYLAGVAAGSLASSLTDPKVYLAGASGGVYALMAAHIATIIMNWAEMKFAVIQLLVFLLLASVIVGMAVYDRYWRHTAQNIGYVAHLAGAVAGVLNTPGRTQANLTFTWCTPLTNRRGSGKPTDGGITIQRRRGGKSHWCRAAASSVNKPTLCDRQPACPAWRLWAKPSCFKPRPPVPGSPAIPGHGGDHGNCGAGGAKNLRATGGHHKRLTLATYNGRTLRLDSHLAQLEVELGKIRWHILGLNEVRREGEDTITLESGHLMYFRGGDQQSQGGVGFLVVQVYAPTSTHSDDEVEDMFDDISRALHSTTKTHYNVVMGDFNAKVGVQNCSESVVGSHGFGSRNHRGQMLVNFLEQQGLFLMNSFFSRNSPKGSGHGRAPTL